MKQRWLGTVFCINTILLFGVHSASVDFPNFPTRDDNRVIVGGTNPINEDVNDEYANASIKMTHMRVRSEIALRYARTAIICKVYNPSRRPQEARFNVLLPETAFISGFTMTIGKENYEAYVKEKEHAKDIYNDAVARGISAAHVAAEARDSNHFTIKFNVEGNSNATYLLRYEELLVRRNGVYNHAINLLPGQLVPKMDVVVYIKESQKISTLRVPQIRSGHEIDATDKDAQNLIAVIERDTNVRKATVTFVPDLIEQKRLAEIYAEKSKNSVDPDSYNIGYDSQEEDVIKKEGLLGQFVVQYDVDQPKNGEILVNDGYFVHFFAPSSLPPLSKHVVFVLDTSSSMEGNKITQLIRAMNAILSDLNPKDYFNIIEFNSHVTVHDLEIIVKRTGRLSDYNSYSSKLVQPALATPNNIAAAKIIVSRFEATGDTDIYGALDEAIKLAQMGVQLSNKTEFTNATKSESKEISDNVEPIIIFLTDGEPTVGDITNTDTIINYISEKNLGEKQAPLFSLAFGENADRTFLRKLSLRNEGFMRQIYEAADAALQLREFYQQVSSPILSNIKFVYPRRQVKEGSVSRSKFRMISEGSEVAVVGRISEGVDEITPQVYGISSDGDGRRKRYEVNSTMPVTHATDHFLPLERLWAYLTIKQLLDQRDVAHVGIVDNDNAEKKPEKKALDIALQYSFVTPLTSLVVVRLNKTDGEDLLNAENVEHLSQLVLFPVVGRSASTTPTKTYTGYSSGGGLSVSSNDGPVLFAQSTKRFTSYDGGFAVGVQGSVVSTGITKHMCHLTINGKTSPINRATLRWTCEEAINNIALLFKARIALAVPPAHLISMGRGNHLKSGEPCSLFAIQAKKLTPETIPFRLEHINAGGRNNFGGVSRFPSSEDVYFNVNLEETFIEPENEIPSIGVYHLQHFGWTSSLIRNNHSLMLQQTETEIVYLKLTKDINSRMKFASLRFHRTGTLHGLAPPKAAGGDVECFNSTSKAEVAAANEKRGSVCVYITRCFAARSITVDDYKKSYCIINDGYAGVCCPTEYVTEENL